MEIKRYNCKINVILKFKKRPVVDVKMLLRKTALGTI